MPAKPNATILLLAQPQTALYHICEDTYLIRIREAKYINRETIEKLLQYQWIERVILAPNIIEYRITESGRSAAQRIEEDMRGYIQLGLPLPELEKMEQELAPI